MLDFYHTTGLLLSSWQKFYNFFAFEKLCLSWGWRDGIVALAALPEDSFSS